MKDRDWEAIFYPRRSLIGWGCPLHDFTYFHGDSFRHVGRVYPPCEECGDTAPQMPVKDDTRDNDWPRS